VLQATALSRLLSERLKTQIEEDSTMRVLVAGATGVVGQQLVPQLVTAGHQVTATTRSAGKASALRAAGADVAVVDGLDAVAVGEAVARAEPEVVIHQMTALGAGFDFRHMDRTFAKTNELRTAGLDHLLAAAQAAGSRRVIAQSYTGWDNVRTGGPVKTEDDPLDPDTPAAMRPTLEAIKYLEHAVTTSPMEGVVLRYGNLYGPGASDLLVDMIKRRQVPLIGNGAGRRERGRGRGGARRRHLQHRGRRARSGQRVASGARRDDRRQEAVPYTCLARAARRRRDGRRDDDDCPRLLQRQGQARTGLGTRVADVARGLRARPARGRGPGSGIPLVTAGQADELRPLMFSIAYRMLGSVTDAEDIVQEAFLRYHRVVSASAGSAGAAMPESPKAYLSAVTTRLCIDHARSARVRRETYVGQWLPEPILTDPGPAALAEQADTLSMTFLLLLERLSCCTTCSATATTRSRAS
jgi:nucleoside-diphosphate-sugar epimerase